MLILTRKIGETLMIGSEVTVSVLGVKGNQVRLGINAPRSVEVHREEVFKRIASEITAGLRDRPVSGTIDEIAGRPLEDARYSGNRVLR